MPNLRTPPNASTATASHATALLPEDGGRVPEWVHLLPAGRFTGRDGRGPYLLDEEGVINAFDSWGGDLSIDYEHQGVHAASNGQPAPAAGWIKQIRADADGIWGRVEWTERAARMIAAREYRYLSPVFTFDKTSGRILKLLNAGLTNNPNLHLTALNSLGVADLSQPAQEAPMPDSVAERVCTLLDLPLDASADTVATALNAVLNRAPDAALYVPRAEFEAVSHRLAALEAEKAEAAIAGAVNGALAAGKILPAQAEHATAMARADLASFNAFVASAPVVAPAGETATHARAADGNAARPPEFAVPSGFAVDADALALHRKVGAHAIAHNLSYAAALSVVAAQ